MIGSLIELTEKAVLAAKSEEDYIYQNCVANDGGLTIHGSDCIAELTWDLRDVLKLLVARMTYSEQAFEEKINHMANPGWDTETGQILKINIIAEALLKD